MLGGSVNAIGAHSLDLFHSSNGPVEPRNPVHPGELYSTLFGLIGCSIPFSQIQSAEYTLFPNSLNPATNAIVNSSLYETPLTPTPPFASNDPVDITFTTLPIGTFVRGYGTPSLGHRHAVCAGRRLRGAAACLSPRAWGC